MAGSSDIDIPYWTENYNHQIGANAMRLASQGPGSYYPGYGVAPQSQYTLMGLTQALNTVPDQAAIGMAGAQNYINAMNQAPGSNPAVDASIRGAIAPVLDQFTEQFLPQMRDTAISQGAYGSTRQGVNEAIMGREALRAAGNISGQMMGNAYGMDLTHQANLMGRQAGVQQGLLTPSMVMRDVGGALEGHEQNVINDNRNRWAYENSAPMDYLADAGSIINGTQYPFGNKTGSSSGITDALGVATTGLGLYNSLTNPAAAVGQAVSNYGMGQTNQSANGAPGQGSSAWLTL